MKRRPLFIANWKMHKLPGEGREFVSELAKLITDTASAASDIVVAPSFPLIPEVAAALKELAPRMYCGSQNCHWLAQGAHTGEVSGQLLARLGVKFAIIGHSERRHIYREPSSESALRVKGALEQGLTPVLCVGETKDQFDSGKSISIVVEQLRESLAGVAAGSSFDVAYEPVWAIGTGLAATPEIAKEMNLAIRAELSALGHGNKSRLLYGGSSTSENIMAFMSVAGADGAIVGGASLDPAKFAALVLNGIG